MRPNFELRGIAQFFEALHQAIDIIRQNIEINVIGHRISNPIHKYFLYHQRRNIPAIQAPLTLHSPNRGALYRSGESWPSATSYQATGP